MNYLVAPGMKTQREIEIANIITSVCDYFGIATEVLRSRSRVGKISEARFIAYYLSNKYTLGRTGEMAKIFDRDRTTIMYGIETVKGWRKIYANINTDIINIESKL